MNPCHESCNRSKIEVDHSFSENKWCWHCLSPLRSFKADAEKMGPGYRESGIEGLKDRSKRPNTISRIKITSEYEKWILDLRRTRKLGARRIQTELKRLHELSLSLATIHKVLTRNNVQPIKRFRRKGHIKRYERPTPGDRVQMDTCKIGPRMYQYTAVDDCTRYRVLALYDRRNTASTLLFLDKIIEEMPFPIQRIQTDRGTEFFSTKVQRRFMDYSIKFRPVKPGSPHLNGKVERSQKTDLEEFYNTVDISAQIFRIFYRNGSIIIIGIGHMAPWKGKLPWTNILS